MDAKLDKHHEPVIVPQVLYEYWSVATRPIQHNGLGFSPEDVDADITDWLDSFELFEDQPAIFQHWRKIVLDKRVKGKTAHDARLVAAMEQHGVTEMLTFNKADFARYSGIHAFSPDDISSGIS